MKTGELVARRLEQLMREQGLTVGALASKAGFPPSTIKHILLGEVDNPGVRSLKGIAYGLGLSLYEFFDTDEFRSRDPEPE